MKLHGVSFKNGDTCEGVSFTPPEGTLDIATITITGRYPERGWAMNELSHEVVYVEQGTGSLIIEGGETISLEQGQSVSVPPHTWFAWDGTMKIIMACQPAFSPKQYKIKDNDEV